MIERQHLQIMREIERQGSLTKAADALFLTQSALSHSVKKLEDSLGINLWQKKGRQIQMTQAGIALLKSAEKLLPQFEKIEDNLKLMAQGEKGILKIGMECHPCYQWLLKVVKPYLAKYPDVDVDVKQKFKFGGVGALYNQEIDLLVTPDPIQTKGLIFIPVFEYEQSLVVATDHPLAHKRFITPEDLIEQTLITYPVEPSRLDIFNLFLSVSNCLPKQHKTVEATDIMLQMVEANRAVACLPKWLVKQYQKEMNIKAIKLGKSGLQKTLYLGCRAEAQPIYLEDFLQLAKRTKG
ncbi:LysR family transcriptional regulator [Marinicellulosiphila megalodicopiae]|uniref:LysR family transcriptional regulator n=1 Tax=Marinicellulosiphila megalodicopiae TaxID=2724896 RepID=UPI003BAEE97D